jgi:hypothetical protein
MKIFICFFLVVVCYACRDKYESPVNSPATGYLVVEGFINTGQGGTTVTLSRVNRLTEPIIAKVRGASVQIENDNNQVYALAETANGVYTSGQLILDGSRNHRLRIRTADNKIYLSAFAKARNTPAIDSVSWTYDDSGVQIYANAHDDNNNTRYYRWEYEQAWEIHSPFLPILKYVFTPIPGGNRNSVTWIYPDGDVDTSKFRCWQYSNSTTVLIGSTAQLTKDVIRMPMVFIQRRSRPISVLYSILVKQFAISKEEYEFLDIMRKNTEITGSIFDAQPSQLKGNIACVTNPGEPVIGYVGVSTIEQKRIFIRNHQLPGWNYSSGCEETPFANQTDSIAIALARALFPTVIHTLTPPNRIDTFYATPGPCIDCTLLGTQQKPSFWP